MSKETKEPSNELKQLRDNEYFVRLLYFCYTNISNLKIELHMELEANPKDSTEMSFNKEIFIRTPYSVKDIIITNKDKKFNFTQKQEQILSRLQEVSADKLACFDLLNLNVLNKKTWGVHAEAKGDKPSLISPLKYTPGSFLLALNTNFFGEGFDSFLLSSEIYLEKIQLKKQTPVLLEEQLKNEAKFKI